MASSMAAGIPAGDAGPEAWAPSGAQRKLARRCFSLLALLSGASLLGTAFSLYLVNHWPLLLVALSPIGRHLVLVAPTVSPLAFVLVAVARRTLSYAACFQLGRALGPAGIVWIEARAARFGRFVRWLERLFDRASHLVVFLFAGPTTSALAGVSGMDGRVYAALAVPGLALRMLLVVGFAEWLREPIEALLALIDEYWIPGTVLLVTAIGLHQGWRQRARWGAGA